MSHISYDGLGELYISDIQEARTIDKSGFDRVITVCQDSIEDNVSDSIEYTHHNMADGETDYGGSSNYILFKKATDELLAALEEDESVLIHCHQGTSRSVSTACAALAVHLDLRRDEAIDLIHHYHPRDNYPNPLLMDHVRTYIENNRKF